MSSLSRGGQERIELDKLQGGVWIPSPKWLRPWCLFVFRVLIYDQFYSWANHKLVSLALSPSDFSRLLSWTSCKLLLPPPTHYKVSLSKVQAVTDPLSTPSLSPLCPDPTQWTEEQVYRWAEWTVQEFSLTSVNVPALRGISGHQLCSFGQQQFQELAYIKEHGLSLQQFLERIRGGELSATSQIEGRSNFIRSLSHRPLFNWLAVHKAWSILSREWYCVYLGRQSGGGVPIKNELEALSCNFFPKRWFKTKNACTSSV